MKRETRDGKSIIIVTHDVEFALEYLPRVLLMKRGEILADGPTKQVLNNNTLIKEASLTLPQVSKLRKSLEKNGMKISKNILLKNEMLDYLQEYLRIKQKENPR